ncbi:unnamed protein product [Withania somnifera]
MSSPRSLHGVNYAPPRSFGTVLKANLKEGIQYFVPICQWLPKYNLGLFKFDLLSGITIASLAIPQGISYAKLADLPPIIGLYSSFVPPLIYAIFGSSKHLAVGTVATCSLIIAETIQTKVKPHDNMELYLSLFYTATLVSGLLQTALGVLRLGFLVDFLSHSTITGFMGGTALVICLQQLKGMFGLKHFTSHTDVVHVLRAIYENRKEFTWQCFLVGVIFLTFLQLSRYVNFCREKKPNLFWVSAIAPIMVVVIGCLFAYLFHAEKYGIAIVGKLNKVINPPSLDKLNLDPRYSSVAVKAGIITAMISLAEGIAIGRSFSILDNEQTDGNKEMIAIGLMNIAGSLTSCYLITGPFSKTAVNHNAGCKSQMSNVVMSFCMLLTLLFLAPLFGYTPLVDLAAIIMSAMLGLIDYEKAVHLYKTDKIDFLICMVAFLGVAYKHGHGTHVVGITSIDITGVETLYEIRRCLAARSIKMILINPRLGVMEKLSVTTFIDVIGKESVFLTIEDATENCRFSLKRSSHSSKREDVEIA